MFKAASSTEYFQLLSPYAFEILQRANLWTFKNFLDFDAAPASSILISKPLALFLLRQ